MLPGERSTKEKYGADHVLIPDKRGEGEMSDIEEEGNALVGYIGYLRERVEGGLETATEREIWDRLNRGRGHPRGGADNCERVCEDIKRVVEIRNEEEHGREESLECCSDEKGSLERGEVDGHSLECCSDEKGSL